MNRRTLSRRGGLAIALSGVAGLCAGHIACSREPTAVIVAVTTDMVVDGDLDELGLYVGVAGEIKTSLRTPTSAGQPAKLPGTLSILQPSDESTPVHVRVAGYKKGELKVVRDAITTVPSGQLSLVRVPLSWLASTHKAGGSALTLANSGSNVKIRDAVPGDNSFSEFAQFFPGYVSPCALGQTSNDGECVDATAQVTKISSGDLMREVYGGALGVDQNGVAEGGTCFDIDACFVNEQTLKQADYQNCKVTIPAGLNNTKTVNFAAVRNEESGCTGRGCFVPLDWDGKYDEATSTFTFPPQVCKRIGGANPKTATTRIAVATSCDAKMASRPRCNGLFGAVRDKAPSDPNRAPYYSTEPFNPNDGQPVPLPDAGPNDAGRDAGPPPPVLLARLTQLQNPRRLSVANDRAWVRGKVGLAFLDARGPSTPTEIASLPTLVTTSPVVDDGNRATSLWTIGNTACVANHGYSDSTTRGGGFWCYDLATSRAATASPGGLAGFIGSNSVFAKIELGETMEVVYPGSASGLGIFPGVDTSERVVGMASGPADRAIFAYSTSVVRMTDAAFPPPSQSVASSILAIFPTAFREPVGGSSTPIPKRIETTANATEAFFVVGATTGPRTALFRRKFSEAGATEATIVTETNLPYTNTTDTAQPAADANYVYWGGGATGPMAISTCTTGARTPKALFPSTGGQDNTTYAVARSGSKLFFATNDGRVYAMDPPAPEACP